MIDLTREIRFSLKHPDEDCAPTVTNSWSGWPASAYPAPFIRLQYTVQGNVSPQFGYLVNIREIDNAVRDHLIPDLEQSSSKLTFEQLTIHAFKKLRESYNPIPPIRLRLKPTPFLSYDISEESYPMLQVTQQFEFSASHRLHNPELLDEENLDLYGKCNNVHGHGHNYVVEVALEGTPGDKGQLLPLHQFEAIVKEEVIDRLDHKYLNIEVDEFKSLNPSVENICIVIYELLKDKFDNAKLKNVRVYETPKTWADYGGE